MNRFYLTQYNFLMVNDNISRLGVLGVLSVLGDPGDQVELGDMKNSNRPNRPDRLETLLGLGWVKGEWIILLIIGNPHGAGAVDERRGDNTSQHRIHSWSWGVGKKRMDNNTSHYLIIGNYC